MNSRRTGGLAILLAVLPCHAHRLDEYLQATLISLEKDQVRIELSLTPGVAVLPAVLAVIDADRDGTISESEQQRYVALVINDLSLTLDGDRVPLTLDSAVYPSMAEMREGMGTIRLKFVANATAQGSDRRLGFTNRHQNGIAVYLVNCLVPQDSDLRLTGQHRSYDQSVYRLDYVRGGTASSQALRSWWSGPRLGMSIVSLLFLARVVLHWRRRAQPAAADSNRLTGPAGL